MTPIGYVFMIVVGGLFAVVLVAWLVDSYRNWAAGSQSPAQEHMEYIEDKFKGVREREREADLKREREEKPPDGRY